MPVRTIHKDLVGEGMGVGLVLAFPGMETSLAYTSDTMLDSTLADDYRKLHAQMRLKCGVLLANLGGVHEAEMNSAFLESWAGTFGQQAAFPAGYRYPSHLGILGTATLARCLSPSLVVVGEMGAETVGLRADIARSLADEVGRPCLPADLGLTLDLRSKRCCGLSGHGKSSMLPWHQVAAKECKGHVFYVRSNALAKNLNIPETDSASLWTVNLPGRRTLCPLTASKRRRQRRR
jgi:hypothetical protein